MPKNKAKDRKGLPVLGMTLILLGVIGLFDQYFPGLEFWPLILIGLGVAVVIERKD